MIIGIAGGTGSGKSTFTNRLKQDFGEQIAVVYCDNYYRALNNMSFEERKKVNYDHPDAFEMDRMIRDIQDLKKGKAIDCPVYDFSIHNRTDKTLHIEPKPVVIVEGILALHDQQLRSLFDIKIFVEADADERILRRVIRDVKERGRDVEGIAEQYLTTVKPMHYSFVEPSKASADIIINSGMNQVAFDIIKSKILVSLAESENQNME